MRSFRLHALRGIVSLALGVVSLIMASGPALADDKEVALRGLVDCGSLSERACRLKDSFFIWTDGWGAGTQHVKVDITWINFEKLSQIDQDDELCLTGFVREDQTYQATSINQNCDEGTDNDKEKQEEKKSDRKEKDR